MLLELNQDFVIENPNGSKTVYPADRFGLKIVIGKNDPHNSHLHLEFFIQSKEFSEVEEKINEEIYTSEGDYGEMTNAKDVANYAQAKLDLTTALQNKRQELAQARSDYFATPEKTPEKETAITTIQRVEAEEIEARQQLNNLKEVVPEYTINNKYSEIVQYFPYGNITAEGLEWLKKQPLLSKTVGDFIKN